MSKPVEIERSKTYVIEVDAHLTYEQVKEIQKNWRIDTESAVVVLQGAKLVREASDAEEAILRVRELHKPVEFISERKVTYTVCEYCTDLVNNSMAICNYPCKTIKALDGEQS